MTKRKEIKPYHLTFNAPVILGFVILCVAAYILNLVTAGKTNTLLFSVYRYSLRDVLTYFRFFGHVLGHSGLSHILNNMMMILLLGPAVEERYGHGYTALTIAVTALITGLVNFIFFPHTALLGASGVVFCFIMMSAAMGFKNREIPITFILVGILYLGEQISDAVIVKDNVSQLTHIIGGVVGVVMAAVSRRRYK